MPALDGAVVLGRIALAVAVGAAARGSLHCYCCGVGSREILGGSSVIGGLVLAVAMYASFGCGGAVGSGHIGSSSNLMDSSAACAGAPCCLG